MPPLCRNPVILVHPSPLSKLGFLCKWPWNEAVCTVRKNPNSSSEEPKEVMRFTANEYFGQGLTLVPTFQLA